jgi:hypothetical protein
MYPDPVNHYFLHSADLHSGDDGMIERGLNGLQGFERISAMRYANPMKASRA